MDVPVPDSAETQRLLERIIAGETDAAGRLFERHRPYVTRLVNLRLDARVRARVDPSVFRNVRFHRRPFCDEGSDGWRG
jgi:hypothetical protein